MRYCRVNVISVCVALAMVLSSAVALANDPVPYSIGSAVSHKNLSIFPLYSADGAQSGTNFLTFDEATKAKKIKVTELNGQTSDAEVEAVHVSNLGDKPIFLMAGEIILGGKQDRIISQNTLIPSRGQKVSVPVFCVEQGRWDGRTATFEGSGKMGHASLRQKAAFGKSQGEVWDEVAKSNSSSGVAPSTGTYKATMNANAANKAVAGYISAVLPPLKRDARAIGVAVAINGKMRVVEAFANPVLFGKIRDKMIQTYALEAATSVQKKAHKAPKNADVEVFFTQIRKASKKKKRKVKSGGSNNIFLDDSEIQGVESKSEAAPDSKSMHKMYMVQ